MLNKDKPIKHHINYSKYDRYIPNDYKKIDELKAKLAKDPYSPITQDAIEYDYVDEIKDENEFKAFEYQKAYAEILKPIFNKLAEISQNRINENTLIKTFINRFNMINELKIEQEKILNNEDALMNFFDTADETEEYEYPAQNMNNLIINSDLIPDCNKDFYRSSLNSKYYYSWNLKKHDFIEGFDLGAAYAETFGKETKETEELIHKFFNRNHELFDKKIETKEGSNKYFKFTREINSNINELKKLNRRATIERTIDFCNSELNKLANTIEELKTQIDLEVVQEFFTEYPKYLECNFTYISMPPIIQVALKQMIKENKSIKIKNNANTEKRTEQETSDFVLER